MSVYHGFAQMYDDLMADIPYEKWRDYIKEILQQRFTNAEKPTVLDLACGTGNMTILLANEGFDMIGVDLSADMLAEAQQKAYEAGHNILFLAQDMRELDLYGTVDAVVCVCDGINYILDEKDLISVFKKVRLFLNQGGVFIFDMNTEYKFKELLGQRSFEAKTESGAAYELDNTYDEKTKINEYRVLFHNQDSSPFMEVHKQRAYDIGTVLEMLQIAGLNNATVHHEYTAEPPQINSARLVFIANA